MTDAVPPLSRPGDPLLRAIADHWDDISRRASPGQRERLARLLSGEAEPDPDEARAELTDQLLEILPPDHPLIRVLSTGSMYEAGPEPGTAATDFDAARYLSATAAVAGGAGTAVVTVYLSEGGIHAQVEEAVEAFLGAAGLSVTARDAPVTGSWFRRMTAGVQQGTRSPAGQDAAMTLQHVVRSQLALGQDAGVTATLMQNLAPLISSLQPTKDAVLRIGALLIVKTEWAVSVHQLTAAQQGRLDDHPHFARSPREISALLDLISNEITIDVSDHPATSEHRVTLRYWPPVN